MKTVSTLLAALLLPCALALTACSSDGGGNANTDAGGGGTIDAGGGGTIDAGGGIGGDSFTVTWGPVDVAPGTEDTQCFIAELGNDLDIHVGEITNVLGNSSHHFIVYRIADGTPSTEPYACQPFAGTLDPTEGAPLMVTQKAEETLTLPEGVAFSLKAGQLIRMEMHYLNATSDSQSVSATSTFKTIADSAFQHEADFLFLGNPDIDLAPGQTSSLVTDFLPMPAELDGANIFGITGHTHQWGTNVTVGLKDNENGAAVMLYDVPNFNWDEPDTILLDPPAVLGADSGFSFTCEFNNQSGSNVGFGEGVDDEMCFFWAYYYPSVGPRVCVHTEQAGQLGLTDICCPGNQLCSLILDNI